MTNALTSRQTTVLDTRNPFERLSDYYAGPIIGDLLKFTKGEYTLGQNNDPVPLGSTFVAVPLLAKLGWVHWQDGHPDEHVLSAIALGELPPPRKNLGDDDETSWPLDDKSQPKDPWQPTVYLPCMTVGGARAVTFTTGSVGGIRMFTRDFIPMFGRLLRSHLDDLPTIVVEGDSFMHARYGKIPKPKLVIIGWVPRRDYAVAMQATGIDDSAELAAVRAVTPKDGGMPQISPGLQRDIGALPSSGTIMPNARGRASEPVSQATEFDDEIPW